MAIALLFAAKTEFWKWAYFCQKTKAIVALPFAEKSVFLKWAYFCQKTKAIALLFAAKTDF